MIPEFGSRLGLICVVILIQSCLAAPNLTKVKQLQSALDGGSTRPTWEMVQEADREWKELEDWRATTSLNNEEYARTSLLSHSILYPFREYAQSIDVNERDSFLDKLFVTYKMFWPYHMNYRKVPGETVGTSLCDNFYEAMKDEQKEKKLTIKDFRDAVEEIKEIRFRANAIVRDGHLPFRHSEVAALFNALIQNIVLIITKKDVEKMQLDGRESVTIDEIKEIFKQRMEWMRKMEEKEEKEQVNLRLKIELEKRQRQSEEAANTLDQIEEAERLRQVEGPNKRRRIERPNDPNPSEEAGPSGHS